jgi:broad specificity phosphatase PhoE
MPVLYLIRHGQTDWNVEGRLQGQRDIPINARGIKQAADAALALQALVPRRDDGRHLADLPFISSPMSRTRQTTEILRQTLGLAPDAYATDDRLKEITFGTWEGLTWRELQAADPLGAAARQRDKWGFQPPIGESYAMVQHRVAAWLAEISSDTCVIAHGGVMRVLLVLMGVMPEYEAVTHDIWQGKVLRLEGAAADWFPHAGDS